MSIVVWNYPQHMETLLKMNRVKIGLFKSGHVVYGHKLPEGAMLLFAVNRMKQAQQLIVQTCRTPRDGEGDPYLGSGPWSMRQFDGSEEDLQLAHDYLFKMHKGNTSIGISPARGQGTVHRLRRWEDGAGRRFSPCGRGQTMLLTMDLGDLRFWNGEPIPRGRLCKKCFNQMSDR